MKSCSQRYLHFLILFFLGLGLGAGKVDQVHAAEPHSDSAYDVPAAVTSLEGSSPKTYGMYGGVALAQPGHIQGVAVVNGMWAVSMDRRGKKSGEIHFIDPLTRTGRIDNHYFTINFVDKGYPSGMQGDGEYLAIAIAPPKGYSADRRILVYHVASDRNVKAMEHLEIEDPFRGNGGGGVEFVGMAYHPRHRRHYLVATTGTETNLYRSTHSDLGSSTDWDPVTLNGSVPKGEAGIALIYDGKSGNSGFYVLSLGDDGSSDAKGENAFSVTKLKEVSPDGTEFRADPPGYHDLNDGSGSFRWGGTAVALGNGRLQVIAAPREYKATGKSNFGVWTSSAPQGYSTSNQAVKVKILWVKCIETTERGEDEIYLIGTDGTRKPAGETSYHNIDDGDVWKPGTTFSSSSKLSISLMEYDTENDLDLIGTFSVSTGKTKGEYTQKLKGDGGEYEVRIKVE